jgi:hypothetical protein
MSERIITHAAASFTYLDATPAILWNSGEFDGVVAEVVLGTINIGLQPDCGIDLNECSIQITPRGAAGVGAGPTVIHTTDILKQIMFMNVLGAVRTSFDIVIFRRLIV